MRTVWSTRSAELPAPPPVSSPTRRRVVRRSVTRVATAPRELSFTTAGALSGKSVPARSTGWFSITGNPSKSTAWNGEFEC